jgi:hypothetical protein
MGAPVSLVPITAAPVVVTALVCPDCGDPHEGDFCGGCGYNYLTGEHGEPDEDDAPVVLVQTAVIVNVAAAIIEVKEAAAPFAFAVPMNLIVQTDSSLDPTALPVVEADRIFPIELAETMVGRRNDGRKIFPEVSIPGDGGIHSRHLKLIGNAAGGLDLFDLGGENGTELNGVRVQGETLIPLTIGDEMVIGSMTRLKIASR